MFFTLGKPPVSCKNCSIKGSFGNPKLGLIEIDELGWRRDAGKLLWKGS